MTYKLNRPDFAKDWQPDSNGNISDIALKNLGFKDSDIAIFIEWGYITPINDKTAKTAIVEPQIENAQ
jgi:hypothetical protein